MAAVIDERALDERLARLEAARPWSPRVVSRLEALIREGDDAALFRVNPFTLAAARGLDPGEATNLLLHATSLGLQLLVDRLEPLERTGQAFGVLGQLGAGEVRAVFTGP